MKDLPVLAESVRKSISKRIAKTLPKKVAVIAVSPKKSREMNKAYRKKDKPTNVLSFFYDKNYGEIFVCPDIVRREARRDGNSYEYQMTWMVVHGMLHMAGLHHEGTSGAALRVEKMEQDILKKFFS